MSNLFLKGAGNENFDSGNIHNRCLYHIFRGGDVGNGTY
jgi:hypothetical protein